VPLPGQPAFASLSRSACPAAERAAQQILSLPLHPRVSHGDIERVSSAVAAFQKGHILA
jgi:dTDP-4-amino-4,6-dideoxygalactose transaminase